MAPIESIISYACNATAYCYAHQTFAIVERLFSYARDAVRDNNAR